MTTQHKIAAQSTPIRRDVYGRTVKTFARGERVYDRKRLHIGPGTIILFNQDEDERWAHVDFDNGEGYNLPLHEVVHAGQDVVGVGHQRNHPDDAADQGQYWPPEKGSPFFSVALQAPRPGEDDQRWHVAVTQGQSPETAKVHRAHLPVDRKGFETTDRQAVERIVRRALDIAFGWHADAHGGPHVELRKARERTGKPSLAVTETRTRADGFVVNPPLLRDAIFGKRG